VGLRLVELLLDANTEGELVQKKSLRDGVFDLLHQRIVAGRYSPGEWLRQEEISTQLGVSQTPVREALDLLVSAGLAERVPYRGVRVPELTNENIVDAYILRLILENAAVRLAALNATQGRIADLISLVEQTRSLTTLDDLSLLRLLNKQLHLSIAESGGVSLMSKLYEMVSNLFPDWRLYEYMYRHPELLETSLTREYQEHKAIVDAIAAHNAELAADHAIIHIQNLGKELVDFLGIPIELLKEKEIQIKTMLGP
jgi:DNA-binding GntR family transcriptional regulator